MLNSGSNLRRLVWLTLALTAAFAAAGCDTYYIPPPPVAITLANPSGSSTLEISVVNTLGQVVPNTLTLTTTVTNTSNTQAIYYVGQNGNYIQGGNNVYGTVDNNGVYTAPATVPNPNIVVVEAVAAADTSRTATVAITLANVDAEIGTVAPAVVTAGQSYTFDVTGQFFAPGATVGLSGAQITNVNYINNTELKLTASVQAAGLLSLQIFNPFEFGQTNAGAVRSFPSSPPATSAIAVVVAHAGHDSSGNVVTATKAYAVESGSLAVVNVDAGKQFASVVLPAGFTPDLVAADPAHAQVIVASYASNLLQVVDANQDQVIETFTAPVTATTTIEGQSCRICGVLVDSSRDLAVLDTAAGYFTLSLADGSTSTPLAAPAAANFSYNPVTQRILAPYANSSGSGVNQIDLVAGTVSTVEPGNGISYGTDPDVSALDPSIGVLTLGDGGSGNYLSLNLNNATANAGAITAAAAPFDITGGCSGLWNQVNQDYTSHLGWFANQGACVGVATLATGPPSGVPGTPASIRWARVPDGPDGVAWSNAPLGAPQALAVYVGPDGRVYGLAERGDGAQMLKMDLVYFQQANAIADAADVNQVDPTNVTVNGNTVSALTYIPLHQ